MGEPLSQRRKIGTVIGAAGFIGRHLLQHLRDSGFEAPTPRRATATPGSTSRWAMCSIAPA